MAYQFWFVVGSQALYGEEVLKTVAQRAEEMARALYMSRPYLSAKFKEETGETLTDFILKEKTEEAKRLLRYSDKSSTAIAAYLAFSSLSHFSRVFKKHAGLTPGEYRAKYTG